VQRKKGVRENGLTWPQAQANPLTLNPVFFCTQPAFRTMPTAEYDRAAPAADRRGRPAWRHPKN